MRIAVTNTVLSNSGDAAIYQSIVDACSAQVEGPIEVTALDGAAPTTKHLYPAWNIEQQTSRSPSPVKLVRRISNAFRGVALEALSQSAFLRGLVLRGPARRSAFAKALKVLSDADVVISSGGTYLVDHYRFTHRVRELMLAKAMGKPIILWTQSMGPFSDRASARAIRRLAPNVTAAYFRDQRSKEAWERVAELPAAHAVLPDTVFGITLPSVKHGVTERPTAYLSVREWGQAVSGGSLHYKDYESGMRKAAETLVSAGWNCIALSTCQGVPGYAVDDSATAQRIFAGLPVEIDQGFHTPDALFELIQRAELVISTRMHLAILSLLAGTPVVAVAYETKTLDLFASLGAADLATPIEVVDESWGLRVASSAVGLLLDAEQLHHLRKEATTPAEVVMALAR